MCLFLKTMSSDSFRCSSTLDFIAYEDIQRVCFSSTEQYVSSIKFFCPTSIYYGCGSC